MIRVIDKIGDFISATESFKYSINIKLDIGDLEKINSFIPTKKNTILLEKLFQPFYDNSISRSQVLTGAYGTGKSLLATILATILSKKENKDEFKDLNNKIKKINYNLAEKIEKETENKHEYLVVLPSNNSKNFKQSLLLALKRSLDKENLSEFFPKTYFKSVINKINQWENDFPSTFNNFYKLIKEDLNLKPESFINKINDFDQDLYEYFIEKYPELTAGGDFNNFYGCDLNEIFIEVSHEIRKKDYQGVYIIYDEFNKLLENDIRSFDGESLQSFAEMTSRSEENEVHMLLISHKNLIQYSNNVNKESANEWKKIEGRFRTLNAAEYSNHVYELMSNVLNKDKSKWNKYKNKYINQFKNLRNKLLELDLNLDYSYKEIEKYIVYGCYPLHPLTAIILPKLSQKIAQNERTIFTYLSTNEKSSLGEFMDNNDTDSFNINRPPQIFDYFSELMKQEIDFTNVHEAYLNTKRSLQKTRNDDEIKFLKTLGLINAINSFSDIAPSWKIMRFALDYLDDKNFEELVDNLLKNKIILYRKSLDEFQFFEGSEINFHSLILNKKEEIKNDFSGKYLLNKYFKNAPVIAKRYNNEFKMLRYFIYDYMDVNDLVNVDNWNNYLESNYKKGYLDGVIVNIIVENSEEIIKAKKYVRKMDNERVIFCLPKKPLELNESLLELKAQIELLHDPKILEKDKLAEDELFSYILESKKIIENKLEILFNIEENETNFYNAGIRKNKIRNKRSLIEYVSEICYEVFSITPKINNELIVKDNISGIQKSARKTIVNKILFERFNKRFGISGYGPDFLIYRTLFRKSNLLLETDDNLIFNPVFKKEVSLNNDDKLETNFKILINEINKYLEENINKKIIFSDIYNILRRKPYGVRLGLIPMILATVLRLNDFRFIIRKDNEEVEITSTLFEEINRNPDKHTLEILTLNKYTTEYIRSLENLFSNYMEDDKFNDLNKIYRIYYGIQKWFQSLSKYARENGFLNNEAKILKKLLTVRTFNIQELMIEIIPKKLLGNKINSYEDFNKVFNIFESFFEKENSALNILYDLIENKIIKKLNSAEKDLCEGFVNWYNNLPEDIKNHTYSNQTNSILNLLRNEPKEKKEFIDNLAVILTGFEVSDWNRDTLSDFLNTLEDIIDNIENKTEKINEVDSNNKFIIRTEDGYKYERTFEETELNGIAKILDNKLKNNFKSVGNSVSDKDKQQILINLLIDLFKS